MELVQVEFMPARKSALVQPGLTLLEAARLADVEIVTGCTRGMCGTDPVRVAAGLDGLEPPSDPERGTLERMGLGGEFRLSCSARLRKGRVVVEVGNF